MKSIFENKCKELFYTWIMKINNPVWRSASLNLAADIPDYFWIVPASSSGKYHPECDLGNGGLVRHSVMVAKVALDLLETEIFVKNTLVNQDLVIITGLFHDVLKQGYESTGRTEFEHPEYAAQFLKEKFDIPDTGYKLIICDAIRTHMGKWNTSKYSDTVLATPQTDFERLIHVADFTASRKYIQGLGGFEGWKDQSTHPLAIATIKDIKKRSLYQAVQKLNKTTPEWFEFDDCGGLSAGMIQVLDYIAKDIVTDHSSIEASDSQGYEWIGNAYYHGKKFGYFCSIYNSLTEEQDIAYSLIEQIINE